MEKILEVISNVNIAVNGFVWGPVMLTLLIGVGLFLTVRTNFVQFRKFVYVAKNTIGSVFRNDQHNRDQSGVSPFQAVATAMAGTIGTGSIAGIATAIVTGGPGLYFGCGSAHCYSEIVLS